MNFWKMMTAVWAGMSLMLLYTYVVEGEGNRMLAEIAFLMVQALMAYMAWKKVAETKE